MQRRPPDHTQPIVKRVIDLLNEGYIEQAENNCRDGIKKHPKDPNLVVDAQCHWTPDTKTCRLRKNAKIIARRGALSYFRCLRTFAYAISVPTSDEEEYDDEN